MRRQGMRAPLIWGVLALFVFVPVALAASSPYLVGRNLAYIVAGFAGILCLGLFLVQPLLAAGYLPGLHPRRARLWHQWVGAAIVTCVLLHVGGLYLTSAPDTLDALLLVSPTPFSVYGVTALWGIVLTAILVAMRRRLGWRATLWQSIHNALALIVVIATIVHAVQIEGTMEAFSKWLLCAVVLVVTLVALTDLRIVKPLRRRRMARQRE